MCEVLSSLHAITGCDSVSAFATKGKKKAFDIVQLYPSLRQIVGSLGERVPAGDEDLGTRCSAKAKISSHTSFH